MTVVSGVALRRCAVGFGPGDSCGGPHRLGLKQAAFGEGKEILEMSTRSLVQGQSFILLLAAVTVLPPSSLAGACLLVTLRAIMRHGLDVAMGGGPGGTGWAPGKLTSPPKGPGRCVVVMRITLKAHLWLEGRSLEGLSKQMQPQTKTLKGLLRTQHY